MSTLPPGATALSARVDAALTATLDTTLPRLATLHPDLGPLADELRAMVLAGGRRIRPVLLLLGHRAAGGTVEDVLGAAVAVELLHTCALLHDDVIDGADRRRGRKTTHVYFAARHREGGWAGDAAGYGESMAILLGDLAFVAADEAFLTAAVAPDQLLEGLRWFVRLREEVMAGQALDVHAAAVRSTDPALALRVATLKSGRYSVTRPLQLGAVLAGADPGLLDALEAVGEPLGRAFQLRDDLLGVFGDAARTGKSTSSDLAEGKRTLLVAEAWDRLDAVGRTRLAAALGDPQLSAAEARRIRDLLDRCGARAAVEERIRGDVATAAAALDHLPADDDTRATLRAISDWAGRREA